MFVLEYLSSNYCSFYGVTAVDCFVSVPSHTTAAVVLAVKYISVTIVFDLHNKLTFNLPERRHDSAVEDCASCFPC